MALWSIVGMQVRHDVACWVVAGLLGPAAGCQEHAQAQPGAGSSSSGSEDPDPSTEPTVDPGVTEMTPTTSGTPEQTGGSGETGDVSSTTTTTTTTTTTSGPTEVCGDGVLDPGETCDLGFAGNNDAGSCTQACQQALCGDGLVWVGDEVCDEGPQNNDQTYGGCREDCTLGPRCGDGALQFEEECDASAPQGEKVVACDPDNCRFNAKLAFVTSATFPGDFGGFAGADAACIAAAQAAGLDNASSFLAWLSSGAAGPAQRFAAPVPNYPYARRDGQQLAYDLSDLYLHGLQVPLEITEHGATLPPEEYAWTNTKTDGQPLNLEDHCKSWTSKLPQHLGRVGQISPTADNFLTWLQNAHWTRYGAWPCITKLHLYCFEN